MKEYLTMDEIPKMEKGRTAMFAGRGEGCRQNVDYIRKKIRDDFAHLQQKGFDTYVVSYGSAYGSLALRVLLQLKREGESFLLVAGKSQREPKCLIQDSLHILVEMEHCDAHIGARYYREWLDRILPKVAMLSHDEGLTPINGVAPSWLTTYYADMDRNPDEGRALLNAAQIVHGLRR